MPNSSLNFVTPQTFRTDGRRLGRGGQERARESISSFFLLVLLLLMLFASSARAAEVMPPAPPHYFNDYAHVVSPAVAAQLDAELTDFERVTSNQILVAIYPKMQSDSDVADYTVRVAESWRVGQKVKKNGVVLFAFIQDHQVFIQVGYGLEGALPDATCKEIIDQEITPQFKTGDYDDGFASGVTAIMAATKGEYKGTGRTHAGGAHSVDWGFWIVVGLVVLFALMSRGGGSGWGGFVGGMVLGGMSGGGGGGGGFSGGGGGGFSGGGGSFGGGGAGGSW
jgi:uncharacterized protein